MRYHPTTLAAKEITTANATIALAELAENGADIDVQRQMAQFMAQRKMEIDVDARCGSTYDEKSSVRINSRNGHRRRA